jgi:hypothetical protein
MKFAPTFHVDLRWTVLRVETFVSETVPATVIASKRMASHDLTRQALVMFEETCTTPSDGS